MHRLGAVIEEKGLVRIFSNMLPNKGLTFVEKANIDFLEIKIISHHSGAIIVRIGVIR